MENHRASCSKHGALAPVVQPKNPGGQWGWRGEVYFASVTAAPESLARFGPPGSGSGTPSPGLDRAGSLLIQPVAGRGWAGAAVGGACALQEGAVAPYIFRLGAGAGGSAPCSPSGNNWK